MWTWAETYPNEINSVINVEVGVKLIQFFWRVISTTVEVELCKYVFICHIFDITDTFSQLFPVYSRIFVVAPCTFSN